MKKITMITCTLLLAVGAEAQVMVDDFETNQYGWTETSQRGGTAIIKDGVMCLEGGKWEQGTALEGVGATCYAPFDCNKPFTLKVDLVAQDFHSQVAKYGYGIGLIFDYEDDINCIIFQLLRDRVLLTRRYHGVIVASKMEDLNIELKDGVGMQIEVEYTLNELLFRVNGVKVLSYRSRVRPQFGEFLLGTSGIGFYAGLRQKVSFDNLRIDQ